MITETPYENPNRGSLVRIRTNDDLTAEAQALADKQQADVKNDDFLDSLAGSIKAKWEPAKRAKMRVEQRMLRAKRARQGEYEPRKLAAIQALYGKDFDPPYPPIIGTKCRDAEAWLKDYLCRPDAEIWDLQPTPIPDLPDSIEKNIDYTIEKALIEYLMEQAKQGMVQLNADSMQAEIARLAPVMKDKVMISVQRAAKKSIAKMKDKIKDQFAEGGLNKAIQDFIFDVVTYPAAFLQGPVQQKVKTRKRDIDEATGKWVNRIEEKVIDTYDRVSPFNVYPSPESKTIDDGYLFILKSMTRQKLSDLIGVKGYSDKAIREVLEHYESGGLKEWTNIESEKAHLEDRDTVTSEMTNIDCLEYQGSASGKKLREWGMDKSLIPDPDKEYQIVAWLIGSHIIKAMLNEDPMGKKNIYKCSYNEDPDNFWGSTSLPEALWDVQTGACATARALVLNVGMVSGPVSEYDKERFPDGMPPNIYPFMKIPSTGSQMASGKAINWYDAPFHGTVMINVFEFYRSLADEYSGIPRYMQGEKDSASKTASGLSMLITNSSRGLKGILINIDSGVIGPLVEAQYVTNLEFEEDIDLIGDCKAVGKGAASIIAKEQLALRRNEYLQSILSSQVTTQIMGMEGIKELMKAGAAALDLDIDKLFGEDNALNKMAIQSEMNARMVQPGMMSSPVPGNPQMANVAGDKVAGEDFALFNQQGNA